MHCYTYSRILDRDPGSTRCQDTEEQELQGCLHRSIDSLLSWEDGDFQEDCVKNVVTEERMASQTELETNAGLEIYVGVNS